MPKKFLSLLLAGLLIQLICVQSASANPMADKQTRLAEKVKEGVSKLGVGQDARVELRLRDKTKLAGYISEVKEDSFVISDAKTGDATTIPYSNVTQVKGHNLSTGAKIAIGIGIGVGIVLIVFAIYLNCCTG
jgi:preprotein translocase subunit SecF